MTEPVLTPDWNATNIKLPFEGFTKDAYPKVTFTDTFRDTLTLFSC